MTAPIGNNFLSSSIGFLGKAFDNVRKGKSMTEGTESHKKEFSASVENLPDSIKKAAMVFAAVLVAYLAVNTIASLATSLIFFGGLTAVVLTVAGAIDPTTPDGRESLFKMGQDSHTAISDFVTKHILRQSPV